MEKLNVAVIGCGYWGLKLIKNYEQIPGCDMKMCCDIDERNLTKMSNFFPKIKTTKDIMKVLKDTSIDAIVVATPVHTHFDLAKKCLEYGKHVAIESPMASTADQCLELVKLSKKYNRRLMVGHTFEYTAAIKKARQIVQSGDLGEIYYISSIRINSERIHQDLNVIWDLAPVDISIIQYFLDSYPVTVSTRGKVYFNKNQEDMATITLSFSNGTTAFLHNSRLDFDRVRRITVIGNKKMMVYDNTKTNEKVKIYNKDSDVSSSCNSSVDFQFCHKSGDAFSPQNQGQKSLHSAGEHFLECIREGKTPKRDGYSGLRLVSILEAANKSIRNRGTKQSIENQISFLNRKVA